MSGQRNQAHHNAFCTCRTSSSVAPLPGIGLGAVDIQETPNAYLFKVDVPGLSKDDVKGARMQGFWCSPVCAFLFVLYSAQASACDSAVKKQALLSSPVHGLYVVLLHARLAHIAVVCIL